VHRGRAVEHHDPVRRSRTGHHRNRVAALRRRIAGDLVRTVSTDGSEETTTFDALRRQVQSVSGGSTTSYVYDGLGKTLSTAVTTTSSTAATTNTYYAGGNLKTSTVTDSSTGSSWTASYTYDAVASPPTLSMRWATRSRWSPAPRRRTRSTTATARW
jgi:YD repeat-containing protein